MFGNPTDKNTSNPNNNSNTPLFGNPTGATQNKTVPAPLFGSNTGGLFGSNTGSLPGTGGLFGNGSSSQLKTSQRKQGGLFGNVSTNKPPVSQQRPILTFGGSSSNTPSSGLFGTNIGVKKQQAPSSGLFMSKPAGSSLFSGSTPGGGVSGGLFGNVTNQQVNQPSGGGLFGSTPQQSTAPSGGLFGNITPTESKPKQATQQQQQQQPSFLQTSGGLFSKKQQKKQEKPQTTLFGTTTTTPTITPASSGLFGNVPQVPSTSTPGGLFSGGDKKQGGLFPTPSAESTLFSKPNQPVGSSFLFGAGNKQEQKKPASSGLFSSITPSTSFGQPSQGAKQQKGSKQQGQVPKFSLTGNITPGFGTSGGLFNQGQKTQQSKPKLAQTQKQSEQAKPSTSGLFSSVQQPATTPVSTTQQAPKPSLFGINQGGSSLFSSNQGGLFTQQKKPQPATNKPAQVSGGLFNLTGNIQKKQTPPVLAPTSLTGSLFGQKKQQPQKQQTKPLTGGLFQTTTGSSTLFNKTTQNKEQKPSTPLFIATGKAEQKKQLPKITQPLMSTFSKPKTLSGGNFTPFGIQKDQTQQQKSRTISFNDSSQKNKDTQGKQQINLTKTTNIPQNLMNKQQKPNEVPSSISSRPNVFESLDFSKQTKLQTEGVKDSKPSTFPTPTSSKPSSFFIQSVQIPKASLPQDKVTTSFEISRMLSAPQQQLKKQEVKSIEQWITLSFTRSNQIPTTQMLSKQFLLHKNQDINRFLNDLFREVVIMVNLPFQQKSFKLINKLFDELLDSLNIKEFLFKCTKVNVTKNDIITTTQTLQIVQLNNAYFTHHMIYKFTTEGIFFNLESQEVKKYLLALTKKFISNHLQFLEFLERKTEMLQLPHTLFHTLMKYCLSYNKLRMRTLPTSRQHLTEIISLVQDFEKKIITKISSLLEMFVNDNFGSFQIINKQLLPQLIKLLDDFSYTEEDALIRTALKVILNTVDLPTLTSSSINAQLKTTIKQTRSLQLLPIRTLINCYQNNSSTLSMISAHDLYRYISGPEWIDWLEVYLSNGINSTQMSERQISAIQAKYMLNILALPKLKKKRIVRQKMTLKQTRYIEQLQKKILPKKRPISKFIHTLKEQNMLDIFYSILESLIYDYESYRRITQTFFKQKDEFIYEFKVIVAEVCNYPLQQFKQEIPFLEEKMSYFLRICEVAPQKIIQIERMVFDGVRMSEKGDRNKKEKQEIDFGLWDVGHRICHLVIDSINYFGMRQNQVIVSKAVSCLKQLLCNEYTCQAMKLAMGVNKPQMSFITDLSSSTSKLLSQKLLIQMMDLLQWFLVSDQFVSMLMVKLRSNNSFQVQLEKYYAVRYSVKEYNVLLGRVGMSQKQTLLLLSQEQLLEQQKQQQKQIKQSEKCISIIPSSYWFLRLLETMIRSFKQEKSSVQLQKQLLYILNLILERLQQLVIKGNDQLVLRQQVIGINDNKNKDNSKGKQRKMMVQQEYFNNTNANKGSMSPIYPLSEQSQQESSRVLVYLIETLNSIDIFSIIKQKLAYSITRQQQQSQQQQQQQSSSQQSSLVYGIQNNLLFNQYQQQQLNVYLSVKVLRSITNIYRQFQILKLSSSSTTTTNIINTKNQNKQHSNTISSSRVQNNIIYKLLSKINCLEQLQQQIFAKSPSLINITKIQNNIQNNNTNNNNNIQNNTNNNNDLLLGLIALLNINPQTEQQKHSLLTQTVQSTPFNLKLSFQKPLVLPLLHTQPSPIKSHTPNINKLQRFYSVHKQRINYEQIHDFMITTNNKYLQAYESIQSVVINTLTLLVSPITTIQQSSLSLSSICYKVDIIKQLSFPYQSTVSSTTWLIQLLSTQLLSFLQSQESSIQLKQSILQLLSTMISRSQSRSGLIFGKRVFYQFIKMYQIQQNKTINRYNLQHKNRINLFITKILNTLFHKDHYHFTNILTPQFIDQLLSSVIDNSQQLLISSQSIMKLLKSFTTKYLHPKQMTFYQLQTSCQERDIISIADALQTLKQTINIVQKLFFDQQTRTNHQQKKLKYTSIKKLTSLLTRTSLPYLPVHIWANALPTLDLDNFTHNRLPKSSLATYLPRVFTSNPLLHLITKQNSLQAISHSFKLYKDNIINYVSQKSITLSQSSIRFLTWSLTIDTTLYGNQPVKKLQGFLSKMSCSSHMGTYHMTPVQMFGQNQIEAVSRVKQLYQLSLHTLSAMCTHTRVQGYCFVETITVMGYCLEWLRARRETDDSLSVLIRSSLSSNRVWLQSNTLSHPSIIKLVHSLSSIALTLKINPSELGEIKMLITQLVSKYMQNRALFVNESIIHQLLTILINFPVSIEDSQTISNVTRLWQSETNSQYFYNLSRLMIEYGLNVPGQLARLKVLTKCQKVVQLFNTQNNLIIPQCYHYGMRSPQSISITWIFKLASTMMSSSQESVILLQQVSEFYKLASKYIDNLLKNIPTNGTISFVYLQLLQTVTEFLLTLVSSPGWVSVYRAQFEKITFLLSHKLINVIMDCIGGKLVVSPQSEMERRLRKQSCLTSGLTVYSPQLDTTSVFKLFSDYQILSLLNLYSKLLSQSLYSSYYISKYFNSPVYENYRYGVSYWDRMNKCIGDMLKYGVTLRKRYQKISQGKVFSNKLDLLSDFANSSQYFVETGYLVSINTLPQSSNQFISLIDQVISSLISLGNVHLIQQSTFRQRYQCIMKGNIQKFANKLIDNVKILQKLYDENQKNYSSSLMSTQKRQTNNYPQYYQLVGKNLNVLIKNV